MAMARTMDILFAKTCWFAANRKILHKKMNHIIIRQVIHKEFEMYNYKQQFKRDAIMWLKTLHFFHPKQASKYASEFVKRKDVLLRIFLVLRHGGLMYQDEKSNWQFWSTTGWPIATALSHGSRIMIQLPYSNKGEDHNYEFWHWLLTGTRNGTGMDLIVTTSLGGGETCKAKDKAVFRRVAATHSLSYINKDGKEKMEHYPLQLPMGRKKMIRELKTNGISHKDSKMLMNATYFHKYHRQW